MSLIGKIVGAAESVGSLPQRAWDFVQRVWKEVETVWSFIVHIAGLLTGAWTWVVNGIGYLADQTAGWAGEVFHTLWQTLTSTIPHAIEWVFNQAIKWAARAIANAKHALGVFIHNVLRFLEGVIHKGLHLVKLVLAQIWRFVWAPVKWVLKEGQWLWRLVSHPGNLAKWLAAAIVEPVVEWFLKAGAKVIVWILRSAVRKGSEFTHLIESVLHDLL